MELLWRRERGVAGTRDDVPPGARRRCRGLGLLCAPRRGERARPAAGVHVVQPRHHPHQIAAGVGDRPGKTSEARALRLHKRPSGKLHDAGPIPGGRALPTYAARAAYVPTGGGDVLHESQKRACMPTSPLSDGSRCRALPTLIHVCPVGAADALILASLLRCCVRASAPPARRRSRKSAAVRVCVCQGRFIPMRGGGPMTPLGRICVPMTP